jgi:hypothetical protein
MPAKGAVMVNVWLSASSRSMGRKNGDGPPNISQMMSTMSAVVAVNAVNAVNTVNKVRRQ